MRPISYLAVASIALLVFVFGDGPARAGVDIYINKSTQQMIVAVDGVRRYTWKVSTGKSGYTTPSGTYRPFRLERRHRSTEWDNAPMPHSIFFTTRGHAIHGSYSTRSLGRAVSHGCVRLAPRNAATLFRLVSSKGLGSTKVTITGGRAAAAVGAPQEVASGNDSIPRGKFGDWLKR
jgi:lipoprotein-anchoring transpeptidase ErfK/SrfK